MIAQAIVTNSPHPPSSTVVIKHLTQSVYKTYLILNNVTPSEPQDRLIGKMFPQITE